MRIIGGSMKGRRLRPPADMKARPTTDFAREALFNKLDNAFYFDEIAFLDLFAGSGAMSFEMYSRGCRDITTVECAQTEYRYIEQFSDELDLEGHCLEYVDVFDYIRQTNRQFDLIFADPPYDLPGIAELPDLILGRPLLVSDGWFVLETSNRHSFEEHQNLVNFKRYGQSIFWTFKLK